MAVIIYSALDLPVNVTVLLLYHYSIQNTSQLRFC
uniref:Uncharacterized protein n=1 Tax=Anguilla anguilla TaxID=7936 RepID=A0A0E9QMV4_ANGAN